MDGSILDLHTVEFKRLIPGPIELAWDYLTKQDLLKTWFADMTVEPRVGGAVVIRFSDDQSCATTGVRGTVSEFRKPNVVAFSWLQQRLQPDGSRKGVDEGLIQRMTLLEADLALDVLTQDLEGLGAAVGVSPLAIADCHNQFEAAAAWYRSDCRSPHRVPPSILKRQAEQIAAAAKRLLGHLELPGRPWPRPQEPRSWLQPLSACLSSSSG
jgi:uncharacterized protein YndB with AHSA1/START domain